MNSQLTEDFLACFARLVIAHRPALMPEVSTDRGFAG